MVIDTDVNAATSSSVRFLRHLEERVPDCSLTILSRALLITTLGEANGEAEGLLALSSLDLAHWATQCSAQAGIDSISIPFSKICMRVHAWAGCNQTMAMIKQRVMLI